MSYQIKFISGENVGTSCLLKQNHVLSIGRSHTNNICLKAPDISGRHIIIRVGAGESAAVEVLSSRVTKHNGQAANIGDIIEVAAGDKIQMGNETVFVFESVNDDECKTVAGDDDATAFPGAIAAPDDDKTAPAVASADVATIDQSKTAVVPAPAPQTAAKAVEREVPMTEASGSGSGVETVAFQTRIASDDELDEIKRAFKRKHYKKILMIALPIIFFFAAAITLYVYLRPATEEFLSWPKDKNGNDLDEFKQIAPYLALCYPKAAGAKSGADGSGVTIITRIGQQQDVPLHIQAMSQQDMKSLKIDHQGAFEVWCEQMRDKDASINFSGDKNTIFLNKNRGAGVPVSYLSYTRRKGNDDYWGYAVFIRKAQTIHTVLFDVPFSAKWRSEKFFRANLLNMVIYAPRRTAEHWEGTASYRVQSDVAQDLEEAGNFMKREAPVYWGRIFYLVRSALIKATLNNDKAKVESAQKMLIALRDQQSVWFSTQKLAYQYAKRNENKHSMRSIQAMCESVFSAEFQYADFRYDLIKRKDWQ